MKKDEAYGFNKKWKQLQRTIFAVKLHNQCNVEQKKRKNLDKFDHHYALVTAET